MENDVCAGCGAQMLPRQYHNQEVGITLCEKCTAKISRHFIEGMIANIEARFNVAQNAKWFLREIEKVLE